jgi:hypothetical protein
MKTCTKCKQKLSLDDFPPDRRGKDGKQSRCRACINEFIKQHYRDNPAEYMLRRAKTRATQKGLEFDLGLSDILPLPTHCAVFGMELTKGRGHHDESAFSLDRIDNTRGYVKGNVVVISYLANRLKNNGTAAQHRRIAEWMELYLQEQI